MTVSSTARRTPGRSTTSGMPSTPWVEAGHGVVVAAHVDEPVAERAAVDGEEPLVLLGGAAGREVALGDDDGGVDGGDLGDGGGVHHLGVRLLAAAARRTGPRRCPR